MTISPTTPRCSRNVYFLKKIKSQLRNARHQCKRLMTTNFSANEAIIVLLAGSRDFFYISDMQGWLRGLIH